MHTRFQENQARNPPLFLSLSLMAYNLRLALLHLATLSTTATNPALPSSTPATSPLPPPAPAVEPPPVAGPPPPPPPRRGLQQQQLDNIIDALIGAGDFASWANILSAADSLSLPMTATLFIPGDNAVGRLPATPPLNFDPFLIPYHVVPQRLTFADLQLFRTRSRLPTLLPNKSILITNNSRANFTVDDSPITHPDLYITGAVAVHGVASVLDYTIYGDGLSAPETLPRPSPPNVPSPPASTLPAGEIMGRRISDAACLCTEFPAVLSVMCAAFAFKVHRG